MNWIKALVTLSVSAVLAACGGGEQIPGSVTGTGGAYVLSVEVQRVGVATTHISSSETVQAVATVTSSTGTPVEGVVVSFSQAGAALLTFAPVAATSLTDANGHAEVDLGASSSANTGATIVQVSALVGSVALTASRSVQITAAAPVPGGTPTPAAINFVASDPKATAIVIKGSGGNGRSESAILTFKIVDASNAPINAALVEFTLNPDNGGAVIVAPSALSNADGLVKVTVSAGTSPASIVVTAVAHTASSIKSQSDTLIVSNSVAIAGGFEIVAAKYNLDGRKTGDATLISAYVRDAFGNPVADGVAVSFQTDYGVVGSSTSGGCITTNGTCDVGFRVQDPRGGGIATVTASVRVGVDPVLAAELQINMAGASGAPYLALQPVGVSPVTMLSMSSCKQSFELQLSDGNGYSTAAGTTISAPFTSTGVVVAIKTGTPVLDQLEVGFPPTVFGIEVDLTSSTVIPACKAAGVSAHSPSYFRFEFKTPGGIVFSQRVEIAYPQ